MTWAQRRVEWIWYLSRLYNEPENLSNPWHQHCFVFIFSRNYFHDKSFIVHCETLEGQKAFLYRKKKLEKSVFQFDKFEWISLLFSFKFSHSHVYFILPTVSLNVILENAWWNSFVCTGSSNLERDPGSSGHGEHFPTVLITFKSHITNLFTLSSFLLLHTLKAYWCQIFDWVLIVRKVFVIKINCKRCEIIKWVFACMPLPCLLAATTKK